MDKTQDGALSLLEKCLRLRTGNKEGFDGTLMGGRIAHGGLFEERHLALSSLAYDFGVALPQFEQRGWTWFTTQERYGFQWEEWRKTHNHFMFDGKRLDSYFTSKLLDEVDESTYIEVYNSAYRIVQGRWFMLMENGHMGCAPDNAYDTSVESHAGIGDLIGILFGCSTPLVIRTSGEYYKMVGEGYVEGFMDGEGIRLVEEGERQENHSSSSKHAYNDNHE